MTLNSLLDLFPIAPTTPYNNPRARGMNHNPCLTDLPFNLNP
jgi:hypothetical protein